jgi:hypothetical protein
MAQWGRTQPEAVLRALGFRGSQMPGVTTLHSVCTRLDVAAFEAELHLWAARTRDPHTQQLVLDGKALRGIHGEEFPGVRLVALYAPEAGLGDRRKRGGRTKEEQTETDEARAQTKQEAELSVAPQLLGRVRPLLRGRLVSGNAHSGQRALC